MSVEPHCGKRPNSHRANQGEASQRSHGTNNKKRCAEKRRHVALVEAALTDRAVDHEGAVAVAAHVAGVEAAAAHVAALLCATRA